MAGAFGARTRHKKQLSTERTFPGCMDLELSDKPDEDGKAEKRAASMEAIETVQVIAALLAGTGITFLDELSNDDDRTLEGEIIRAFVLSFIALNMYGLIVLSTQLFYLRQCMAKDTSMFDPFLKATKDTRYYALKGVLYSMVVFVGVLGLRQYSFRQKSQVAMAGGLAFVGLAIYCLSIMKSTRRNFATLRRKSRAKTKLKASVNTVMVATAAFKNARKKTDMCAANATSTTTNNKLQVVTNPIFESSVKKNKKSYNEKGKIGLPTYFSTAPKTALRSFRTLIKVSKKHARVPVTLSKKTGGDKNKTNSFGTLLND